MLQLNLLGVPRIAGSAGPVALRRRQPLAMLAVVALAGSAVSRERLAFLFWDDVPDHQASQRLRRVLSSLRRALAVGRQDEPLQVTARCVALLDDGWSVDVDRFGRLAARAAREEGRAAIETAEQSLALYRGPLLDGFHLADAPEFEQWLLLERSRVEQLRLATLARLVAAYEAVGELSLALDRAGQLLQADLLTEEHHLTLMRLLAADGQRGRALAQFDTLTTLLATEFGAAPSPGSQRLYEQVRSSHPPAAPRTAAPAWPVIPSLALTISGREVETVTLRAAIGEALAGAPLVTCLHGPSGIGKTRLIQEVAGSLDIPCWIGGGQGPWQAVPFASLQRALTDAIERGDPDLLATLPLESTWRAEAGRLIPALRHPQPGLAAVETIPSTQRQSRLCEALAHLATALAEQAGGALLVLDDLDEADPATLASLTRLLERLQRRGSPLAIVVCYRAVRPGSLLERWRDDLARRGWRRDLPLRPLSRVALRHLLRRAGRDPALAPALLAATGGIPFYAIESIRAIQPVLAGRTPIQLPDSVRQSILADLRRLDRRDRRLLEICAFLPTPFDATVVAQVGLRDELEGAQGLETLRLAGCVLPERSGYRLSHGHLARTVRESLGAPYRALLERRAAGLTAGDWPLVSLHSPWPATHSPTAIAG